MATTKRIFQHIIADYRAETGETDIDMRKVAAYAVATKGVKLPKPQDPLDRLAKDFSSAAREEIKFDELTNQPYRANHAYPVMKDGKQRHLWLDIDGEAPRYKMKASLTGKREQMIGEGLQGVLDAEHWSRIHPNEEPLLFDLDLTDDVLWRRNAPEDIDKAS